MRNNTLPNGKTNKPPSRVELLQAIALLNLESALAEERYEEIPQLIENAKNLGATQSEINVLIEESVNTTKTGRRK